MADVGDFDVLPCGCTVELVIENEVKMMKYVPCSLVCDFYLWTVAETQQQGKPIEHRKAP